MSNEYNNWNMPYKKPRLNQLRPPPGLTGKEIGMFFRNRHMKNKLAGKPKKDFSITFTMPPAVATAVKKNMQSIIKTAEIENIILPPLKKNYMSSKVLSVKTEPVVGEDYNADNVTNIKHPHVKTEFNDSVVKSETVIHKNECILVNPELVDEKIKKDSLHKVKLEPIDDFNDEGLKAELFESDKCRSGLPNVNNIEHHVSQLTDCNHQQPSQFDSMAGTSTSDSISTEDEHSAIQHQLELRHMSTFKYGYEDIITGTFEEKLEESLARGIDIAKQSTINSELSIKYYNEYNEMKQSTQYKKMLEFRKILPTYTKSQDILNAISQNQVLVISGETGCGKSTQVPQIILDDAIYNKRGAYVKILVTEPRRIAASSLAMRVASERAEKLGKSVGYAVRLERVLERQRGSIQYCTTGILLTDLEVNQSLSNYSHIILDEVHERDSHIDLAMCTLKKILKKRKDLKLILMSATIDADSLAAYFDDCLKMHIEGLAYPVKDVYLEEVLAITKFRLSDDNRNKHNCAKQKRFKGKLLDTPSARDAKKLQEYLDEVGAWINSKRNELDVNVIKQLKNPKIEELNFDLIVELIAYISKGQPGAILVFVPGFNDISKLLSILHDNNIRPPRFEIYPLHSKLPTLEQHKIFERPPSHIRKIIVATNIAETSITVDDIVYVIDCGRHKITGLNIDQNVETLNVEYISKANLRQRRGRAGRCQPGVCYHLVTSFRAERLAERTPPELQRSNLLEAALAVKRLRLGRAADALQTVPSPPAPSTVQWAVKHLQRCGALNAEEKLTPLGWHMARLPVHPAAGKLLLLGALFGCLDRAASVAAVWGFKDPFLLILGKEREIEACKRDFTLGEPSDHIAVSEAIIGFEQCPRRDRRSYCYDNFLSYNTCELLSDMKKQLGGNLKAMGFLASGSVKSPWENRNANNLSLFKAIVAAALYPNIGTAKWIGLHSKRPNPNIRIIANTPEDGRVSLHPSSAMASGQGSHGPRRGLSCNRTGANWIVYWMKRRSTELYILDVTLIYSLPLLFFGDFILSKDPEAKDDYLLDVSSIKVRVKNETADLLHDLRAVLDHVLASKVMSSTSDSIRTSKFEEQILNTVMELITAEDEQAEYVLEDLTESDYSEND